MLIRSPTAKYYFFSFLKHDFKASITVFFVAMPLCLGISLASNVPLYAGLIAGIIGGIVVSLLSKSELSVSGPAAGLTTITAVAIAKYGAIDLFFLSVAIAGTFQIILGLCKLGAFTHFIPSSVIKGMLTAIGIMLMAKQIPIIIGYDQPDFWTNEFFNVLTLNHSYHHLHEIYDHTTAGVLLLSVFTCFVLFTWKRYFVKKISILPTSIITVLLGSLMAYLINRYTISFSIKPSQFVHIPANFFSGLHLPDWSALIHRPELWTNALIICLVASMETLLSITAIDKLDPLNRVTPQNRELMAQGTGNLISGFLGGLPITAVIVRSSANAEAGAKTKLSSVAHGFWLLLAVLIAIPLLNRIPFSVLAVILLRTGYYLAKPKMIIAVYRQGREQFLPFLVTVVAILLTDLLIGVVIGCVYAIYFLIKHTYRAGYVVKVTEEAGIPYYNVELALNVSFLNKGRFVKLLDSIPKNAVVEINGSDSVYIDRDVLEIFNDFKRKAQQKNIRLSLLHIPEVETIELH